MAVCDCFYDSAVLGRKTALRVVLPDQGAQRDAPIFTLLHGLDGTYLSWFDNTELVPLCERYGVVFLLPDAKNSYYTDSETVGAYYTQIATELPARAAQYFNLRGAQHIAGVSMGGHGALKLALHDPARFETAASFSGVIDLARKTDSPFFARQEQTRTLAFGAQIDAENDLFSLVRRAGAAPCRTRFYQFCGTEDFLYDMNREFRDAARASRLNLTYREDAGDHTWPVWNRELARYIPWAIGARF